MKRVFLVSILIAAFALVATHSSNRFFALGTARAGNPTDNAHELLLHNTSGTDKFVLQSQNFRPESCATTGALIVPFTVATTGQQTASSAGNSCETGVAGYFDAVDPTPSTSQVQYTVGQPSTLIPPLKPEIRASRIRQDQGIAGSDLRARQGR